MHFMNLGPGTYQGDVWPPDEVAKGIVSELKLKDGSTVSKDKIIEYLAKAGLGPLWATDVAMVLRNMFGVTPIFYESRQSKLFGDLDSINESTVLQYQYPVTDYDLDLFFASAVQSMVNEAASEDEELVIAALSLESIDNIIAMSSLADSLSSGQIDEAVSAYLCGGESMVEDWYDMTYRPHLMRFWDNERISALEEAIPRSPDAIDMRNAHMSIQPPMGPRKQYVSPKKVMKKSALAKVKDNGVSAGHDPLANRAGFQRAKRSAEFDAAHKAAMTGQPGHPAVAAAGNKFGRDATNNATNGVFSKPNIPNPQAAQHKPAEPSGFQLKTPSRDQAVSMAKKANEKPFHLTTPSSYKRPADYTKDPVPDLKPHPIKHAIHAIGKLASWIKGAKGKMAGGESPPVDKTANGTTPPSEAPGNGKPGLGSRIASGAKDMMSKAGSYMHKKAGNFGDAMKARMRIRHPGMAYALHGAPSEGEKLAAQHMGMHQHYKKMGYDLQGYNKDVHNPAQPGIDRRGTGKRQRVRRQPAFVQ